MKMAVTLGAVEREREREREREVFLKSSKKETTRGNCAQKGRTVIFGDLINGNIADTVYINYDKIVLQNI